MAVPKVNPLYRVIKRFMDIVLSAGALVALSPLLLVLCLVVRKDGGKAFYSQIRVGRHGKQFAIYKFRSMVPNADRLEEVLTPEQLAQYMKEFKLDPDPRITKIGRVLRKTSLDELPQLWNILKGDMSIVGPRPLLPDEVADNYTQEMQERLLSVRPGLTGYWQASSRNESRYETGERQGLELYYIGRVTPWMDIKIILKTVKRVFSGKGAV